MSIWKHAKNTLKFELHSNLALVANIPVWVHVFYFLTNQTSLALVANLLNNDRKDDLLF